MDTESREREVPTGLSIGRGKQFSSFFFSPSTIDLPLSCLLTTFGASYSSQGSSEILSHVPRKERRKLGMTSGRNESGNGSEKWCRRSPKTAPRPSPARICRRPPLNERCRPECGPCRLQEQRLAALVTQVSPVRDWRIGKTVCGRSSWDARRRGPKDKRWATCVGEEK